MQIPGVPRPGRLTLLVGLAGVMGVVGPACVSPEMFHKNRDGGLLAGTGGAGIGNDGATAGEGGATSGSGGTVAATGGASASGGAGGAGGGSAAGGNAFASGGGPGSGGAAGGFVAASGGNTAGAGGGVGSGGTAGTVGGGGRGTGGAGGTAGEAGTGGGGTAGGSSMSCPSCTLTLTYLPIGTADGQSIGAEVHVGTANPVAINQISIKYWYTNETGESDISTDIDYIGLSNGQALANRPSAAGTPTTPVTPARTNANTVTSITVPETMTLTPGTQLYVKFRIHATNYKGKFTMANDYSFGATQTLTMQWPRITAYVGGVRAWGNEPTP